MKSELEHIYREPQVILQRAAYTSRAAGWPPLVYGVSFDDYEGGLKNFRPSLQPPRNSGQAAVG